MQLEREMFLGFLVMATTTLSLRRLGTLKEKRRPSELEMILLVVVWD